MVPNLLFSDLCSHSDLDGGQYIDFEGKEDGFRCDKLISGVKGLDFVLLFMGIFLLVKCSFYFRC